MSYSKVNVISVASDVSAECPSTEYAIPHMSGEAGATGGYPPPLPHSKPPLHTLNTFLGKPPPTPLPPNAAQPQESFYAATEIVAVSDVVRRSSLFVSAGPVDALRPEAREL